jgi:hypothetical protein
MSPLSQPGSPKVRGEPGLYGDKVPRLVGEGLEIR